MLYIKGKLAFFLLFPYIQLFLELVLRLNSLSLYRYPAEDVLLVLINFFSICVFKKWFNVS